MIMSLTVPSAFRQKILPAFRTWLFPEKQEVYYIGGSDILPPPLEMEEEARAIEQLCSEHNEHARKQLIEHNLRLVVYIAKKFDNTGVGVEDLISIGTIGLIKAINTFNPEKNIKLATYALSLIHIFFKMAPIHHHFELCGWSETRIVAVFSIITAILCLIALLAL